MKVSKKIVTLFTFTLIVGLLTVGTVSRASNSFVKLQPPTEGVWTITGLEIISDDVIINGSIIIEEGGELRIIDSNVDFLTNSSFFCTIELEDGATLYVENSILRSTNSLYNFEITGTQISTNASIFSTVTFIDSYVYDADISINNADGITMDTTDFVECSVYFRYGQTILIENTLFEIASLGLELEDCNSIMLNNTEFDNVDYGLYIDDANDLILDTVEFGYITEIGLQIDDINPVTIINGNFHHTKQAALIEDSRIVVTNNMFWNLETGIVLDNADFAVIDKNNFTDITDVCIEAEGSRTGFVTNNRFVDSYQALDYFTSPNWIEYNYFDNIVHGVIVLDSDGVEVTYNEFYNVSEISVELIETRDAVVSYNVFNNVTVGIDIIDGRGVEIASNILTNVGEGIGVILSREVTILGNTVNNTVTGFYIEQSKDIILTANGAINAEYGISMWSTSLALLASNGVFDSVYGVSIWFSEDIRLLGNDVNTSDIGIVARNTITLEIKDGAYKELTKGIQLIGCLSPKVSGNSFDQITEEAITLIGSNGFKVYNNNFGTVGFYGTILDCIGTYYIQVDNVTFYGNYYVNEPGADQVLIDTVIIDTVPIDIIDLHPLDNSYTVVPSIEFISRDIKDPQDTDTVVIDSQIFVPADTEDVVVILQYLLNDDPVWTNIDITSSGMPVGSIGSINAYSGTIPAFDYDNLLTYRIIVEYSDELVTKQVSTVNSSYLILFSAVTPIVISTPDVALLTTNEDDQDVTLPTGLFYEDEEYIVLVEITNRTEIEIKSGKNHVNITWSEFNPDNNVTTGFTALMDFNGSAIIPYYYFEFGKGFTANTIIDFFISVIDINGTYYRTVNNYTIFVETPVEPTGFDALTLLSIGATLLVIQAMVVYRRKRKQEE